MKKQVNVLIIMIVGILFFNIFSGQVKGDVVSFPSPYTQVNIRVGIYSYPSLIFGDAYYPYDGYINHIDFPYYWQVGNTIYKIDIQEITTLNEIITDNIDVLVLDGITELETKTAIINGVIKNSDLFIRQKISDYIIDGGGYIGHCSGTTFPLLCGNNEIKTISEYMSDVNAFLNYYDEYYDAEVSIKWHGNHGIPVIDEYFYWMRGITGIMGLRRLFNFLNIFDPKPEYIGTAAWWMELDNTYHGVPRTLKITNEGAAHPILDDYHDNEFIIGWAGGSAIEFPSNPISDVSNLAYYEDDLSSDAATDINAWSFQPFNGLFWKIADLLTPGNYQTYEDFVQEYQKIMDVIKISSGWTYTNRPLDDGHDYRSAFATIDNYRGGGRLVLDGVHPFLPIFNKSDAEIIPNTDYQNPKFDDDGLYRWKIGENDLTKDDLYDPEYDWYVLRQMAWAFNDVPDNHMPPVYGQSQVIDFTQPSQSDIITIECAVQLDKNWKIGDEVSLDLYYKYLEPNNWSNWILHDTITNEHWSGIYNTHKPWEFNFNTNDRNGSGFYQFCSILRVSDGIRETSEAFPPGPDAVCSADMPIFTSYDVDIPNPYVNQQISFTDESIVRKTATTYKWIFGDGDESTLQNPTHTYSNPGTYTLTFNVTDNESNYHQITKNITIYNNHPSSTFTTNNTFFVIGTNYRKIGGGNTKTISFTSTSSDTDGSITNYTWDFGEGNNGYGQTINHTYNTSNLYTISHTITDNHNATNKTTKTSKITVVNALVNNSLQTDDPTNYTWTTIQKAIDNTTTYDIIYLQDGNFDENLTINKSIIILGNNRENVILNGTITMNNPYDHELINNADNDYIVNMSGNTILFHFNNETEYGEDYATNTTIYDYSGQNHNGTLNNALWTNNTIKGPGALTFNGNNHYIHLSYLPALTGENITISAWINWTGGTGTIDPILSQSIPTQGYCLYINNSDSKPAIRLDTTTILSTTTLSTGWHNIIGIHNGTSDLLKLYVDGQQVGSTLKTGSGLNTSAFIGYDNNSNYYNGTIDEVAVWNRTLTDQEIKSMYYGNNGVWIDNITIQNSNIGITPVNYTTIKNCRIINNTIGILLNQSKDISIENCIIDGGTKGIQIIDSSPDDFHRLRIIDSTISNVTTGIDSDTSANFSVVNTYFNCTTDGILFNDSTNISSIYIINCDAYNNVKPSRPVQADKGPSLGDPNITYYYESYCYDTNGDQILYHFDWGDGNTSGWIGPYLSNETVNLSHSWENEGGYYITIQAKDVYFNESEVSEPFLFKTETVPPIITNVSNSPSIVGFGQHVTIAAEVVDNTSSNHSDIQTVSANITYPNNTYANITLNSMGNDTYQTNFTDIWLIGQYNYTIWAIDNAYNSNSSTGHSFNVSAAATMTICTIKDSFSGNESLNLTDPPFDPPYLPIGYELLDNGQVLHIWNTQDSYYFNTTSGIQLTNHKDDYWTKNILMLGYYNNDQWNLLYRTDELTGFSKSVDTDNLTYVNATLWKDLSYQGYDFRLAIRYHLGLDDTELTVIPYIKNLGQTIPYILGFGWEIRDIQIGMTPNNNYIDINKTTYPLNTHDNTTLNITYSNLEDPRFYLRTYQPDQTSDYLYLTWDENLTYNVKVMSQENQYNAPISLFIRIGTLASGQEKQTVLHWYDGFEEQSLVTYYFDTYDLFGEKWTTTPQYMVDGSTSTHASTTVDEDIQDCPGNTCIGSDLGIISAVELRVNGKYSGSQANIILQPEFGGTSEGDNHIFTPTTSQGWSSYFDITEDTNAPDEWGWDDVDDLDCTVYATLAGEGGEGSFTAYCYKVEIRVTYTSYQPPTINNPNPQNSSIDISIAPVLNVTVDDGNDDTLTATWYSNSSNSWVLFAQNASINTTNGAVNIIQTNTNFSDLATTYYWSVNVSDGIYWTNKTYHFTTETSDTMVNPITPYIQTSSPVDITANGSTSLDNVTLWYRYSTDNETWGNASWWNSSWDKRRQINLNVSSGSTPVNYQMLMNITYLSGMNTDFSDLRFIKYADNSTELDYWIQETHNGSWCHVWVEFPSSITTTNTTHAWLYYGSPSAGSQSNGSNTFLFFDDFSGTSLNSSRWPTQSGSITVDDGTVHLDFPGTSYAYAQSPSQDYTGILEFRANYTYDSTIARFGRFIKTHYGGTYLGRGIHIWDSGAYILNTNDPGTYHNYRIVKTSSNALWYFDDVYTFTRSITGNIGTLTLGNSGESGRAGDAWFDHIRIREYSASEPTYHVGVDQIGGWQPWDNASNPDTSSPWQWIFDFPNGLGYYEFYSIGMKNGSADENPPSTADTGCSFRNQSKIMNTGSTNISGYLLMQIHYYNSTLEEWEGAFWAVNETTPRTINASSQLGLDTIFNGLVNTNDLLTFGTCTYRVYAAFRDPYGNVLICDDETKLEAIYEFTIQFS